MVSRPPASSRRIFQLGFSDRRLAKTHPAGPEPTIMKSYSLTVVIGIDVGSEGDPGDKYFGHFYTITHSVITAMVTLKSELILWRLKRKIRYHFFCNGLSSYRRVCGGSQRYLQHIVRCSAWGWCSDWWNYRGWIHRWLVCRQVVYRD